MQNVNSCNFSTGLKILIRSVFRKCTDATHDTASLHWTLYCIPGNKHCDSEYKQMKEVKSEWQRETRELETEKNNSTSGLSELIANVPPESLGFLVHTKSHLLMEGCPGVHECSSWNLTSWKTGTEMFYFKGKFFTLKENSHQNAT